MRNKCFGPQPGKRKRCQRLRAARPTARPGDDGPNYATVSHPILGPKQALLSAKKTHHGVLRRTQLSRLALHHIPPVVDHSLRRLPRSFLRT